jgi:hypothetical protein
MSGVAVAGGHPSKDSTATLNFELEQNFDVVLERPGANRITLTLDGRVVGLLRSHCKGGGRSEQGQATAVLSTGATQLLALTVPAHSATGGEGLSVNCKEGPVTMTVPAGSYKLNAAWIVPACHPRSLIPHKAASAEFAPDPALDPLWISYWEPFHGAAKKDFGLQISLKVSPANEATEKAKP